MYLYEYYTTLKLYEKVLVLFECEADKSFINAVFELLLERLETDEVGALAALLEAAGEAEARLKWAVVHSKVRVPVPVSFIHTEENSQFSSTRRNVYIVHNCYAGTDQNYQ